MKLAVTWQMCGYVDVPEDNVEDAIAYFNDNCDHIKLPKDGDYVDGSFELSTDDPDEMEQMVYFENVSPKHI